MKKHIASFTATPERRNYGYDAKCMDGLFRRSWRLVIKVSFSLIDKYQCEFGQGGQVKIFCRPLSCWSAWTSLHIWLLIFNGKRKKWTILNSLQSPAWRSTPVESVSMCTGGIQYKRRWSHIEINLDRLLVGILAQRLLFANITLLAHLKWVDNVII